MSKEHAWPEWLGFDAEVDPTQATFVSGYARTGETELTERFNEVARRQRSVLTNQLREVCAGCNSGWMSRLETAVEPLLKRLWAPAYPLGRTTLAIEEAATVAAWATKTVWVHERLQHPQFTASAEARRQLREHRLAPEGTSVWLGRHQGQLNFATYLTRITASHRDDPWDAERARHVLVGVLVFRGLALVVRIDDGDGVPRSTLASELWHRLWPVDATVQWPPQRLARDGDAQRAAADVRWLRQPAVSTFHRSPDQWQEIAARELFQPSTE